MAQPYGKPLAPLYVDPYKEVLEGDWVDLAGASPAQQPATQVAPPPAQQPAILVEPPPPPARPSSPVERAWTSAELLPYVVMYGIACFAVGACFGFRIR